MKCRHKNSWANIADSGIWWCPDCGSINRGGTWVKPSRPEKKKPKTHNPWTDVIIHVLHSDLEDIHISLLWLYPLYRWRKIDLVWLRRGPGYRDIPVVVSGGVFKRLDNYWTLGRDHKCYRSDTLQESFFYSWYWMEEYIGPDIEDLYNPPQTAGDDVGW